MRYIKPHYYDEFNCVAGNCPDTCCAGWQIVIDEEALEKYGDVKGEFGERLKASIDWNEGTFRQNNRRCCFLNERNLCDLYTQLGEEALCKTCTMYPRHVEEFADLREYSLSLSCPAAAKIILECQEPTRFSVYENDEPDELEEEFEDFDYLMFTQLEDGREVIFNILQNRQMDMRKRMALVLEMAKKIQSCVDEQRLFDVDEVIEAYRKQQGEAESLSEENMAGKTYFSRCKEFSLLLRLERLRDEWSQLLESAWKILYENGEKDYLVLKEEFDKEVGYQSKQKEAWSVLAEQLMMFFVYTYFCGAVYDDQVYSKMALAVFCTEWIEELVMARWALQGKNITKEDYIQISYRLAREIEHSDVNLNLLEEWLEKEMEER